MKIGRLIKITPGKRHGWYETDQGFNVKKPIGGHYQETESKSWWRRLLEWLFNWFYAKNR